MTSGPVMARLIETSVSQNLPLNIHFDLTYRCNERCIHCYLDHDDRGELATAEVVSILEQLAEAGTLFLTFSGGEIFLRRDLFAILGHARRLRFDLSLKSNALLIDAERAARLKQLGVHQVQISIYSADAAVHDAITCVPGSLERSLRAIRFLQAQGLPVKIACPLMRHNLAGYASVTALAEELGVPYVLDLTITPHVGSGPDLRPLRAAPVELLPVLTDPVLRLLPAAAEASGAAAELSGVDAAYDNIPCSAGHNSGYISPYGDVFPCVQMPLPTGNLRRNSFREIWYGSPELAGVRAIRESGLRICSSCEIRMHCRRCPGLALMEEGDLMGPSARACELAEQNARLAGVAHPVSAWRAQQAGHGLHNTPELRVVA